MDIKDNDACINFCLLLPLSLMQRLRYHVNGMRMHRCILGVGKFVDIVFIYTYEVTYILQSEKILEFIEHTFLSMIIFFLNNKMA